LPTFQQEFVVIYHFRFWCLVFSRLSRKSHHGFSTYHAHTWWLMSQYELVFYYSVCVVVLFWPSQSYLRSPIWSCAGKGDQPTTTVKEDSVLSNKSVPHKNKYSLSSISCFGVDLTPDNIAVAMVYFVQGVLGLARLAVSFYLKDDLHLDPAEVRHPDRVIYFLLFVNLPSGTKLFSSNSNSRF